MIERILNASRLFRESHGQWRGFLLWLEFLKEKLCKKGEIFSVHVPGLRHAVWLRAGTSDVEAFCQLFAHREMDFYTASSPRYLIDAGANIGMTSIHLANRFPAAAIDALEVDPENIKLLKRNAAPYPNIRVIEKGLWHRSAILKVLNPEASSWAFKVGEAEPNEAGALPALGVQDLLRESGFERIDLLKIDIEGAERDVFGNGNTEWIEQVQLLAIELHDRDRPGCTEAVRAVVDRLQPRFSSSGEYQIFDFRAPERRSPA